MFDKFDIRSLHVSFFRYLKMQLHWRHRKHCLWKILLFVSTFSKG